MSTLHKIREAIKDNLVHVIVTAIVVAAITFFKAEFKGLDYSALLASAREVLSPVLIAVLLSGYVYQLRRRAILQQEVRSKDETLRQLGMALVSRHATQEEKDRDWDWLKSGLKADETSKLSIMGATGLETFAESDAPLNKTLKEHLGSIRVLLLLPYSKGFNKRVKELGVNEQAYCEEILESLDKLKRLQTKYEKNIEVKLYSEITVWKMIWTPSLLWLQSYAPKEHVNNMPVYGLKNSNDKKSLYATFCAIYEKRWSLDGNPEIKLTGTSWHDMKKEDWLKFA